MCLRLLLLTAISSFRRGSDCQWAVESEWTKLGVQKIMAIVAAAAARRLSSLRGARFASTLVLADHNNVTLGVSTLNTLAAAKEIGGGDHSPISHQY